MKLVVLKTIFKRLVSGGFPSESPARDIKNSAKDQLKFHVITPEEERAYLPACPQPLHDIVVLMLETGMQI
ncbi:MAG TPA: hypothetical protein VGB00_07080 [Pyrinomonadaceae bacterium]